MSRNYKSEPVVLSEPSRLSKSFYNHVVNVKHISRPVRILDRYLTKLPETPAAFYLLWLPRVPESPIQPWYKRVVHVGINPLKKMMPTISERAGLGVHYTNHSFRATTATTMFTSEIPGKVVSEVTGLRA